MSKIPDRVILSVRLASGDFESSITIPLDADDDVKKRSVGDWLQLAMMALRSNVTEMRANLSTEPRS